MEQQDDYIIPFRGLALEVHRFQYDIDGTFFEELDYSELQNGDIHVDLALDRQERMLIFDFKIGGTVDVTCDRCLDTFPYPVDSEWRLIVKFGEDYDEEDDVVIIPEKDHQIDVAPYIYEYIMLMLPIRKVHPDDADGNYTCNPDMISILEKHADNGPADSRWDALQGLKDDLENLEQ